MESAKPKEGAPIVVFISSAAEREKEAIASMKARGCEVNVIQEPRHALNLDEIKPKLWRPSIFFVDVSLPQMSGFELTRRLVPKWAARHVPILLFSAHLSSEDENEAIDAGAIDIVAAPLPLSIFDDAFELARMRKIKTEIRELVYQRDFRG